MTNWKQPLLAAFIVLSGLAVPAEAAPVVRNTRVEDNKTLNYELLPKFAGKHNLHLYFGDNKPFLDEVEIFDDCAFRFCLPMYVGVMRVPNDFEGPLRFVEISETRLVFDVTVPSNRTRPENLVFRYDVMFRNGDYSNGAGLVHVVATGGNHVDPPKPVPPRYVGSFVLFRKPEGRLPSRPQQPLRRR